MKLWSGDLTAGFPVGVFKQSCECVNTADTVLRMGTGKVPVVILVRVSTEKQETDRQVSELRAYADSKGYDVLEMCKETVSGRADESEREGLMAWSEVETLRERINSGLAEARRKGVKLGRPNGTTLDRDGFLQKHKDIARLLKSGQSVRNAEKISGKGVSTVQRVKGAFGKN